MLHGDVTDPVAKLALAQQCFGGHDLAASQLGGGHYLALTDFRQAQEELADITAHLEGKSTSDQILLHALVSLATRVERATAQHSYRFSATRAYATLASHFQRDEQ